jgi:hypothetical protein
MRSIPRRMISRDGVLAIVTANGTAPTEATFPLPLEQSKVLIFATVDDPETEAIEAARGTADRVVMKLGSTDFSPYGIARPMSFSSDGHLGTHAVMRVEVNNGGVRERGRPRRPVRPRALERDAT